MPTDNDKRAHRCGEALFNYGTDNTLVGCLTDILTDARHWCDRHGLDYAQLDRRAYHHYVAELGEERGSRS